MRCQSSRVCAEQSKDALWFRIRHRTLPDWETVNSTTEARRGVLKEVRILTMLLESVIGSQGMIIHSPCQCSIEQKNTEFKRISIKIIVVTRIISFRPWISVGAQVAVMWSIFFIFFFSVFFICFFFVRFFFLFNWRVGMKVSVE